MVTKQGNEWSYSDGCLLRAATAWILPAVVTLYWMSFSTWCTMWLQSCSSILLPCGMVNRLHLYSKLLRMLYSVCLHTHIDTHILLTHLFVQNAEAAMQGVNLLTKSNLGFNILLSDGVRWSRTEWHLYYLCHRPHDCDVLMQPSSCRKVPIAGSSVLIALQAPTGPGSIRGLW